MELAPPIPEDEDEEVPPLWAPLPFVVLVCGGRRFEQWTFFHRVMDRIHTKRRITLIIEGGARGADRYARWWADHNGVPHDTFPADWSHYGPRAGPVRNQQMLDEGKPDFVVAFEGGAGTADMVARAQKAGVRVMLTWKYRHLFPD